MQGCCISKHEVEGQSKVVDADTRLFLSCLSCARLIFAIYRLLNYDICNKTNTLCERVSMLMIVEKRIEVKIWFLADLKDVIIAP